MARVNAVGTGFEADDVDEVVGQHTNSMKQISRFCQRIRTC